MPPRLFLAPLLYGFLTLLVAFAVVMGGYLLAVAVQDSPLALALRIIGIGCLLLLVVDGVLLLVGLTIHAVTWDERRERRRPRGEPLEREPSSTAEEAP